MSDALTVSTVQYQALDGGVATNAMEHVRLIEDAESHGSRLVVFPELSLTGYDLPLLKDPGQWLQPEDPRLGDVREICRRTGITAVVGGAYREADGTPRLAALAIHPEGVTDVAFKTHLHGQEKDIFAPGGGAVVLELDGWKIALAICFDAAVPSHSVLAAGSGADAYAPYPPSTPVRKNTGSLFTWAPGPWTIECSASWRTSAEPPPWALRAA
ncbi:carbon-nitrogen hydrolase family protein [Arthrobacter sp. D1-29]